MAEPIEQRQEVAEEREEEGQPQSQNYKIKMAWYHRILVTIFILVQYKYLIFSLAFLFNYYVFHFPFIAAPSMVSAHYPHSHYLLNILLILIFWVQFIGMATIKFKLAIVSLCTIYALYQHFIYVIMTANLIEIVSVLSKPSFRFLFLIPLWVCIPFLVLGAVFFVLGFWGLETIVVPFDIKSIIYDEYIEIPKFDAKTQMKQPQLLYRYVRHPIETGVMILLLFANGLYTVERVIFIMINFVFIVIEAWLKERRMCDLKQGYKEYMEKVRARFIPFVI